jgi:act minimal PKS acyl carrier protein
MTEFIVADLEHMLRSCAGAEQAAAGLADVLDVGFADLGYDSLALLELANQVQRAYGVPIPDEAVEHMTTPQATVDYINSRLAEVRV